MREGWYIALTTQSGWEEGRRYQIRKTASYAPVEYQAYAIYSVMGVKINSWYDHFLKENFVEDHTEFNNELGEILK